MKKSLVYIVLIVVILGGAYYFLKGNNSTAPTTPAVSTTQTGTQPTNTNTQASTSGKVVVTYTNNGFSPSTVTINKGDTVTFVNQSSNSMWVATDPHPSHTGYDGTSRSQHCASSYSGPTPFDQCQMGNTYTFTFDKVGTWGYHNHAVDQDRGTIVVQ